jgi:hypothetical protein
VPVPTIAVPCVSPEELELLAGSGPPRRRRSTSGWIWKRALRAVVPLPENLALLGTMSDQRLAARLHIGRSTVRYQRQRHQIPPFRFRSPEVEWTAEMLALLGRVRDPEVARRHGIPLKAVKTKRRQLGIPTPVEWGALVATAELRQALLLPSTEVRRRTGLGWHTICRLRRKLGIEARPLTRFWQPAELALLGTAPDREIAERLGRSVRGVRRKRGKLHIPAAPDHLQRARHAPGMRLADGE